MRFTKDQLSTLRSGIRQREGTPTPARGRPCSRFLERADDKNTCHLCLFPRSAHTVGHSNGAKLPPPDKPVPPPMTDITAPALVQVEVSKDRTVLWVNVDGFCRLRICRIHALEVHQPR
jgi:hypothetical protein